jgi:hypothetical protein
MRELVVNVTGIPSHKLWSSGQSSWLQIQRSGFDSQRYQIFWEVVGLERGPLSLVSTIEELFGRKKSSSSGLEIREYCRRDPSRWPHGTLYPPKLPLTSLTSSGNQAYCNSHARSIFSKVFLGLGIVAIYTVEFVSLLIHLHSIQTELRALIPEGRASKREEWTCWCKRTLRQTYSTETC